MVTELQVLLQNWVPMAEQLDSMLSSKSQQKHKEKIYGSWQNDFYPYTIVPAVLYSDSSVSYTHLTLPTILLV